MARQRLGQHFLEPAWVAKLVRAIDPQPGDTFLEIGPGRGALTRPLATSARLVIAVEIDRALAASLRDLALPNVHVVEADFLDWPGDDAAGWLTAGPLRVAGNLPYYIASPILFRLLDLFLAGMPIVDATVMLQREVADRLLADPGTKDYGLLTVLVRHAARIDRLMNLPSGAFRPPPRVASTVVRLRFHPEEPAVDDRALFRSVVQAAFGQRRKMLLNTLRREWPERAAAALDAAGIVATRRPETLTVGEFAAVANHLSKARPAVLP